MSNKIYIILGPTSSGKTSLTLNLCKKLNGEIISADSRQTVKHMDIGTGKQPITSDYSIMKNDKRWIVDDINIWGYDLTEPDQYFSGVDWAEFALNKTKKLIEQGKQVFVVGGTGFYIDLFTASVKPSNVKPDLNLRKKLNKLSLKQLQDRLTTLSPEDYKKIDENNPVRLIRAIEKNQGEKISPTPLPYLKNTEFIFLGLTGSRKNLYNRADTWAETVWKNGLVEEVKQLIDLGYAQSPKLRGLVYKQTLQYINNEMSEEDALQKIKYSLHAYIRRQQTYFKKMLNIKWFDITHDDFKEKIYTLVNE